MPARTHRRHRKTTPPPPPPPPPPPSGGRTIIGSRIAEQAAYVDDYPGQYDRHAGDYVVEAYEAAVRANGGPADYILGANRTNYNKSMGSAFSNTTESRTDRDGAAGRIPIYSYNAGGSNAQIDATADDWIAWVETYETTAIVTGPHEPNDTGYTSTDVNNWWRGVETWWTRFENRGVPICDVDQDGTINTDGLILCGPNLAGAAHITNPAEFEDWYPASETWGWAHIQMCASDMYQGAAGGSAASGVQSFRAFEELLGATAGDTGFYSWSAPKITAQNALGRTLLRGIFEFACDEEDKIWPEPSTFFFEQSGGSAIPSSYYASLGIPVTMPAWIDHMGDWIEAHPGELFIACFYDASAVSGGAPSGRGPHMVDMTAASWDAWCQVLTRDCIRNGG